MIDPLCRAVLALYPAAFRRDFGAGWIEVARWRLRAAETGRLRAFARWVLRDGLTGAVVAWHAALRERLANHEPRQNPGRGPGRRPGRATVPVISEMKIALRRLRRAPGFAAVAALTLALAIGANTAVFSIADAVLFRPLPYDDADSLFVTMMGDLRSGAQYTHVRYDYLEVIEELEDLVAGIGLLERGSSLIVQSPSGAEVVRRIEVTPNYFELLGVGAAHGRLFRGDDRLSGGNPAVLTWTGFQRRLSGDEGRIGGSLALGGETLDVVGVLPRDFVFPSRDGTGAEVVTLLPPPTGGATAGTFYPIVRLRAGVTREQAGERIAALVSEAFPRPDNDPSVPVLEDVRAMLYPTGRPIMRFLLTAALLVLLLGCANLANMLLARTRLREHEIGVQAALGASRGALLRPLLFEALLIGLVGACAALVMTTVAFGFLLRQVPAGALGQAPVGVGWRVAGFAFILGALASVSFAALPAWRAARLDAQALLRGSVFGSDKRGAFGRPMLATQVGLAVVLVFGALLATRALVDVLRIPLGFEPRGVLTVTIFPPVQDGAARQAFYSRALDEIRQRPDVIAAGAAGALPLDRSAPFEGTTTLSGEPTPAGIYHVLPGYFDAAGIELIAGRLLSAADRDSGANVAVVAQTAARHLFGERDPLGGTFLSSSGRPLMVIGVVNDVTGAIGREDEPQAYVIAGQATRRMTLVVRARARDDATLAGIRRQVRALAPAAPVAADWWNDEIASITAYRNPRFQTLVLGSFAALALGLTGLGVFGLVAFLVAARMREMGIRLAIGAGPARLQLHALHHALLPTAAGLVAGLAATRILSNLAAAQLYEVETSDPLMLAAAVLSVAGAAVAAAWLPARRAARVDPMTVLRME